MRKLLQGLLLLFAALPLAAQQSKPFDFSIKNIMRGPELYGRQPDNVRWSADSRWIYFTWLEPGTDWRETPKQFRVRAVPGAKPERVSIQQVDSTGYRFAPSERSHNGRYSVVEFNGDLFINDLTTGTIRRLTQTVESEHSPQFSANDRKIFFVRSNNIYSIDLSSGFLRQVTDIRQGPVPADSSRAQGQRGRLEQQQRDLFESVRDRIRADSIARLDRLQRDSLGLRPVYLQSTEQVSDFSISPTGTSLLITTRTPAAGNRTTDIPQYVTRTGYTEELRVRTKVGDAEQRGRVALITLPAATVTWLKTFSSDTTTGAFDLLGWNDAGTRALLYAYSDDNKTRLLQTVDPAGKLTTLEEARDTAWIGGPCSECGGWYGGGAGRVWYVSEADGFSHLYTIAPDGTGKQQLTRGKWEVREVALSPDDHWFHLQTNQVSPFEQHLYRMPTAGGTDGENHDPGWEAQCGSLPGRPARRRCLLVRQSSARSVSAERQAGCRNVAADSVAKRGVAVVCVDRTGDRDDSGVRRRPGARAHLQAERHARAAEWSSGDFRARRRIPAQRREFLVRVPARVHVQPVSRVEGLHGRRSRLSRVGWVWARLANGDLPAHGWAGPPGPGGCVQIPGPERRS